MSDFRVVRSTDGTPIAVHRYGGGDAGSARPPLLLVHGTASDHTTWRYAGPALAASRPVFAMDRRGRPQSGDTLPWSMDREYEDVASVAARLAGEHGGPVDLLGHSFGGRTVLGAALVAPDVIRRVVSYEGAPIHVRRRRHLGSTLEAVLGRRARPAGDPVVDTAGGAAGDPSAGHGHHLAHPDHAPDRVLERFLSLIVEMSPDDLAAYREHPVWPSRVEAAGRTLIRELEGASGPASGLERLGRVRRPVLLVLGTASAQFFVLGTERLAARLPDVRVARIEGARHAAHHTHVPELVAAVTGFLDSPAP